MNLRPGGSFKPAAKTVLIQRRVQVDEDGREIDGTEEFWLTDGQGNELDGPFFNLKEALGVRDALLNRPDPE